MIADNFQPSPEAPLIEASVNRRGIKRFFHFAPIEAVPSILAHRGIHPRSVLRERAIQFVDAPQRWSNNPRKAAELEPYVATGIVGPWGMMRHYPDCVVFSLEPRLLWRAGTSFVGKWSSSNQIQGVADVEARESVAAFDSMFDNSASVFPAALPGEVLILGSISLHDVRAVLARDQQHIERILKVVREARLHYPGPPIGLRIRPHVYPPRPQ